jgi:hypothetical protein
MPSTSAPDEDLRTGIEHTLGVWAGEDYRGAIRPDVLVVKENAVAERYAPEAVAVAEPVIVPRLDRRERHLEIVDPAGRVITVIEFLSPWNKVGQQGREQYAIKQKLYLDSGVNLVEIDLVRQGAHVLAAPEQQLLEAARRVYKICVFRHARPERFEVYPASLRERLPNIPIPLRSGEAGRGAAAPAADRRLLPRRPLPPDRLPERPRPASGPRRRPVARCLAPRTRPPHVDEFQTGQDRPRGRNGRQIGGNGMDAKSSVP